MKKTEQGSSPLKILKCMALELFPQSDTKSPSKWSADISDIRYAADVEKIVNCHMDGRFAITCNAPFRSYPYGNTQSFLADIIFLFEKNDKQTYLGKISSGYLELTDSSYIGSNEETNINLVFKTTNLNLKQWTWEEIDAP